MMTDTERLERYRRFITLMDEYMTEGSVKIDSCRVLFGIQFERLLRDARAAESGAELENEIGWGLMTTPEEQARLRAEVAQTKFAGAVTMIDWGMS